MSVLTRRMRGSTHRDIVIGAVAVVVVLGLSVAAPGEVGILLAALAVGTVVGLIALNNPVSALILVVLASFLRTAQKEFVSTEALTPMFYAMLIALALAVARRVKQSPRLGTVEWLMSAYLVWNLVSALLPHEQPAIDPISGASVDVYRWIFAGTMLPFVTYVVAKTVLDDERSVRILLWTTVGMTAYSAWVSILQFHGPKSLVWPSYIVDDPNWRGRANGLFNQPVVNGMLLVIGFVVILFLASRPDTKKWTRRALYALAAATAYSVYLTHTRAALLALVVALGMGVLFAKGWRRGFVGFILLGVAGVAVNARDIFSGDRSSGGIGSSNEIYDRLNIMATSLKAVAEHPFLGIGIGRFQAYNTYEHTTWSQDFDWNRGLGIISHENELGIAAELGIPGVTLWISVVVGVLYLLWKAIHELPSDRFMGAPLALVGAIAMVTLVVNGFTVDLRILDFASMLPFVYAGMVVGMLERHRAHVAVSPLGAPGAGLPGGASAGEQRAFDAEIAGRDRPLARR